MHEDKQFFTAPNHTMVIHSTFQYSYLWLPLIGLIIGLIATIVGGSGGSVFPPILILFFNVPAHVAIATSLAAALPIGFVGTIGHWRKGHIRVKTGMIFILTGFAGAMAGAFLTRLLSGEFLKMALGIYMIVLGFFLLHSMSSHMEESAESGENSIQWKKKEYFMGSSFGFLAGSAAGMFGTSGTAPVLAGMLSLKLPVKIIAGTSLMVVFVNALSGFSAHLVAGQVDITLVLLLAAGSVLGSIAGPILLSHFNSVNLDAQIKKPKRAFRYGLTSAFLLIGMLMIFS